MGYARRRWVWLAGAMAFAALQPATVLAQASPPPIPNVPAPTATLPEGGPAALTQTPQPQAPALAPETIDQSCPFAGQGLSVTPSSLTVRGATVLTQDEINRAIGDLLGREQDLAVICTLRDRVANLYERRGYRLTRVELPPQRISGGAIELVAVEGYLDTLTLVKPELAGPSAGLIEAYLRKAVTGQPLYWPDLERAILLARDVPGIFTDIRLRRSPTKPGAVDLVAEFSDRNTFTGLASIQDLGAEDLGRQAALVRLDANSLTPFGERTSLVGFGALNGGQYVVQALEEVRIGSSGLILTADVAYAQSTPGGLLSDLDIEGSSFIGRVGFRYPLQRSRVRSITLNGGFEYIDQENILGILSFIGGDADVLFNDKLRVLTLGADIEWRPINPPDRPPSGLDVRGSLGVRKGLSGLGANELGVLTSSRFEGNPEFTTVRASGSARWTFGGRPVGIVDPGGPWVELRAVAQWADGPLLAFEEYQIGNYSIGRGFDPGSASGDSAYGAQFEVGWPILKGKLGPSSMAEATYMEPYAFYDIARVENEDLLGYTADISSAGIGFRMRLPFTVVLDFAIAQPLTEPFPGAEKPDLRFMGLISVPFTLPFL